jgi:hypothetical protein
MADNPIILYESSIIAGQAQEPPKLPQICWDWPFANSFNFCKVSGNPFSCDDVAQIFQRLLSKHTLTILDEELMLS